MAESEHAAGSWLGDLTNEWKTAKPPEKILIIAGVAVVGGIAFYLYKKQQGGGGGQTINAPGQGQGQGTSGGQSAGFPTIPQGQLPVLPSGIQPIYDPNGNLVGYGPATGTPPSGTPSPSTGAPPTATGTGDTSTETPTTSGSQPTGTGSNGRKPIHHNVVHNKHRHTQHTTVARVAAASAQKKQIVHNPYAGLSQQQAIGLAAGTHPIAPKPSINNPASPYYPGAVRPPLK